jgi:ATP-dependent RNA helicase DOB1
MNGKGGGKQSSDIYKLVKMIMERNYEPAIVFRCVQFELSRLSHISTAQNSFSKRDCEAYAMQMSKLDFNNDDEKALIESVFANAIDTLTAVDRQLPQVCLLV